MPIQVLSLFVRGSSLDIVASSFIGEVPSKTAEKGDDTGIPRSQALPSYDYAFLKTT